ncbi:hypothetical protein ABTE84_19815, partial [Acinetobacter baumannii]
LLALMRAEPSLAHIPAVAVTAEAMPDERARALAAGFQGYWTKPLDLARLPGDLAALLQPQQAAAAPSPGGPPASGAAHQQPRGGPQRRL